jgi:hypothetical protein
MTSYSDLRTSAVNRHRKRVFGESSLDVYQTTPEDGETIAGMFTEGWFGQRISGTTDAASESPGAWQFQVGATLDWETSQAFMMKAVALKVGARRWKVKKVEKPIGLSLIWKINAEIQ